MKLSCLFIESAFWKVWGKPFFKKVSPTFFLFLTSSFFPTLVAHSDVGIITADEDLATGGNDVTVTVDTGVYDCFVTAGADGFDLGNRVGNLKETQATGEEVSQKVGTQTKAKDRNIVYVNDSAQLIDLLGGEELAFVGNNGVAILVTCLKEGKDIGIGSNDVGNGFKTDARADDICTVAIIDRGLNEPNLHVAFLIIETGNERVRGFGRTHCTVFKV